MFILNRRNFMQIAGVTAAVAGSGAHVVPASAAPAAEVFTADPLGGLVDSVLVVGDEKALLIDAQFTVPNASRLADVIAATGRALETIYISHYHPDHHLGLSVLKERFPDAVVVAHAAIQPGIAGAAQAMLDGVKQAMSPELFGDTVVIPDALAGDTLSLEGEDFEVLDPLHGDTDLIAPVHLPQLDTLVAADLVYNGTHVWTAENTTPERIAIWRDSLDTLEAVGAGTIIPGHRTDDAVNDASGIAFMRTYLDAWEAALGQSGSADDLKADMLERVGDLPGGLFLDRGVAAARG